MSGDEQNPEPNLQEERAAQPRKIRHRWVFFFLYMIFFRSTLKLTPIEPPIVAVEGRARGFYAKTRGVNLIRESLLYMSAQVCVWRVLLGYTLDDSQSRETRASPDTPLGQSRAGNRLDRLIVTSRMTRGKKMFSVYKQPGGFSGTPPRA